jgi:hypothetical protein
MLIPVKQLYPIRLAPSASITTNIETQLPVVPLLRPRIFFLNTSIAASVRAEVTHVLDLGTSTDPLLTGTFSTIIVNQTLAPEELLTHLFLEVALTSTLTRHTFTLQNLSAVDTVIVQVWVEGWFEEGLKDLPDFLPILI